MLDRIYPVLITGLVIGCTINEIDGDENDFDTSQYVDTDRDTDTDTSTTTDDDDTSSEEEDTATDDLECSPLEQDCDGPGEACFHNADFTETDCAIPNTGDTSAPGTQGEPCAFTNACAKGYGCTLIADGGSTDRECAYYCHADGVQPTCATGPGGTYECVRLNEFYSDAPYVDDDIGICILCSEWPDLPACQ